MSYSNTSYAYLCNQYNNMSEKEYVVLMTQDLVDYPETSRKQFLVSRPWFSSFHLQINNKLNLIVPNTHIVSTPYEHIDLDSIISNGKIIKGYILVKEMELSKCHDNCEILFAQKEINNIYSGYALSTDGLWRFHSWGINLDGDIVETTCPRILYYGVTLY